MASGLPLREDVIATALPTEGVKVSKQGEQITINIVVDSRGGTRATTRNGDVGESPRKDVVDGGKQELIVGIQRGVVDIASRIHRIVLYGRPPCPSHRQPSR